MASKVYHPLHLVAIDQPDPAWYTEEQRKHAHHDEYGSFPAQYHTEDIWQGNESVIAERLHRRVLAEATPRRKRRKGHKVLALPHKLFKLPFRYRLLFYRYPTVIEERVAALVQPQQKPDSHFLLDQLPEPTQKEKMRHGG